MYCKNCGKKLEDDTRDICLECEKDLNNAKVEENTNQVVVANDTSEKNTNSSTNYQTSTTRPSKSKIAAGIFGIFFGALGIHNFYLGYTGKAVIQLLITVLSFGVLSFVSAIWGFIEGILILSGDINKDANGNPLRDE